jgi:rhodanese-related sulfurtransferase
LSACARQRVVEAQVEAVESRPEIDADQARPAQERLMSNKTPDNVTEYEPEEVRDLLAAGKILLVDVREPMEYAAERIPGALLYPLSTFDAAQLPPDGPRQVVFSCAAGGRSLTAARQRLALGQPAAHLAGGISEWKAEGLPVVRIDPRTGRPV